MTEEEMDNCIVSYSIEIRHGIDVDGQEFWATKYVNNVDKTAIPVITGLGMLEATKIDLLQRNGMIPMPAEIDGDE